MKFYLTIILSLLVAPIVSMAALDASLTGSTITVSGVNLTVTDSGSVDSLVVDSNDIKVVLSPGANITFSSSDRRDFTVTPYTFVSSETCDSSASTLRLYMDPSYLSGTVATSTITLSSSACDGTSGGGGGGGGSGVPTPVYTVIPGTASSQGATVTQTTTGQTTTKTISTPSGITITITKTLKLGSENSEVRQLQTLLARDTGIYPEGKITGYYGTLTRKAVQNFQKKYGIVSSGNENTTGYGLVGPKTLAKIKEVFGATGSGQTVSIDTSASREAQIQAIQTLINQLLEQVKALQAKKTQ